MDGDLPSHHGIQLLVPYTARPARRGLHRYLCVCSVFGMDRRNWCLINRPLRDVLFTRRRSRAIHLFCRSGGLQRGIRTRAYWFFSLCSFPSTSVRSVWVLQRPQLGSSTLSCPSRFLCYCSRSNLRVHSDSMPLGVGKYFDVDIFPISTSIQRNLGPRPFVRPRDKRKDVGGVGPSIRRASSYSCRLWLASNSLWHSEVRVTAERSSGGAVHDER